ncbi:MAG: acetyl-CoA carboxylase biotin carboxyl carrier protein [Dorea sp.]|jgi:acetyl-CoA carboxylase biotin carboxyl carrier protein|nr:acetyl-CoA carboxylase biotin carboxyl carrier protein [Dorea sp.]
MEIENLIKLIKTVSESDLTGLKYEENGVKLHLTKKKDQVHVVTPPAVNMPPHPVMAPAPVPAAAPAAAYGADQAVSDINVPSVKEAENTEVTASQKPAGKIVESPLVGTFYAAPAEDAAPFVSVGDTVKKGQTLAIIEAMKLMNEIESEYDGTIAEILVENGQPVEYGQPLFRIQ